MELIIKEFDLYKDGNKRRLFVKEGSNFRTSKNRKAILVHDAHNVFNEKYSSFNMSWHLPEALEGLNIDDYIIFGLECLPGVQRIKEYSPVNNRDDLVELAGDDSPVFGVKYLNALFNNLIPYVEKEYNFNFKECNKVMLGSSMGGVITTYAALEYKNKFDTFLAFSNAFFANAPYIFDYIKSKDSIGRYYQDIGGKETSGSISNSELYKQGFDIMNEELKRMKADAFHVFDKDAGHNELAWSKRLPAALNWCFNNKR